MSFQQQFVAKLQSGGLMKNKQTDSPLFNRPNNQFLNNIPPPSDKENTDNFHSSADSVVHLKIVFEKNENEILGELAVTQMTNLKQIDTQIKKNFKENNLNNFQFQYIFRYTIISEVFYEVFLAKHLAPVIQIRRNLSTPPSPTLTATSESSPISETLISSLSFPSSSFGDKNDLKSLSFGESLSESTSSFTPPKFITRFSQPMDLPNDQLRTEQGTSLPRQQQHDGSDSPA